MRERSHASYWWFPMTEQSAILMAAILVLVGVTLALFLGFQWLKSVLVDKLTEKLTERLTLSQAQNLSAAAERTAEKNERSQSLLRTELQSGISNMAQTLEGRFQSLESQVSNRLHTIGQSVETRLSENLKEGFKHFEKVQTHLAAAELKLAGLAQVGASISDLNQLLKLPHLRGGFGETTLERLLQDFVPQDHFELQVQLDPKSTERVDATVTIGKHRLPIDSKFPRESVLPLFESSDPLLLEQARKELSRYVREQAKSISKKYIRPELGTTDMALLFLPSETLYFEVIRDSALFEALAKERVYPISPNTLAMGLKSVTLAHEYYEMARGVETTIDDVKKARKHFEHFEGRFEELGRSLEKAQDAYRTAHTHLGRYGTSVSRLVGQDEPVLGKQPSAPELGIS